MTKVVQFSLFGLVMLGSVMLAFAEGTGFPDALTIPLSLLALFVCDRWKLFRLSTRWANCLGLTAFSLAIWELSGGDIESRLLSFAHLLVYLTWILLFLEKTPRLYWTLCAMALLHVALGAVLTSSGTFGALLVLFFIGEIWMLTVFTLHRARQRFSVADELIDVSLAAVDGSETRQNQQTEFDRHELLVKPKSYVAVTNTFIWNRRSRAFSAIQIDPDLRWISWPLVSGVAGTVFFSAILGCVFFLFTPRIWVGDFTAFGDEGDTALRDFKTGFTDEVHLGNIGQILESSMPVFEMRLVDQESGQTIPPADYAHQLGLEEPLFRGTVLGEYENGKWRGSVSSQDIVRQSLTSPTIPGTVRQEFSLVPTDSNVLFAMPPYLACKLESKQGQVLERRLTSVLYRDNSISSREPLKYVVFSEKHPTGTSRENARGTTNSMVYRKERDFYVALPKKGLERLQVFAKEIAQSVDKPDATPLEIARRLEHRLKNSGEFGYTLDLSITDPSIDVVEDFLFNRKQGHCEYFASALALMLRSVDIPARLVSGFKGGDLNEGTGYFVVQQRHAHVWVEAYLNRTWVVFDGTPASREESVNSLAPKKSLYRRIVDFFTGIWSHHVIGMNMTKQDANVYTPIKEMASEAMESLNDELEEIKENGFHFSRVMSSPIFGFMITGLCLGGLVWLVLSRRSVRRSAGGPGLWRQLRNLLAWILPQETTMRVGSDWRSRLSQIWSGLIARLGGESAPQRMRVEFYERFLRVLKSGGHEPLLSQTAAEFVSDMQPHWQTKLNATELAALPPTIVAEFYRVRFGGESLSVDELRQLNRQLENWEEQWRRRDRKK